MKKFLSAILAAALTLSFAACGNSASTSSSSTGSSSELSSSSEVTSSSEGSSSTEAPVNELSVAMVTDVGGVNDQSFNQSAWEGLQKAQTELGVKSSYVESKQETDYSSNLDMLVDGGNQLIFGIGYKLADSLVDAASKNADVQYCHIDSELTEIPSNVVAVRFNAQEPSFLAGCVAAKMTKTNKVAFVGGMKSQVIDQFEFGFRAGVAYTAKELGKEITVDVQYADSFSDSAKGKSIALKQYADGADVIFHAAGGVGNGVIEAAKEQNKWVIGVDRDQNYLAPDNVLTSVLKDVGQAMYNIVKDTQAGENYGGKEIKYGIKDGCLGLAPSSDKNVPAEILTTTKDVEAKIVDGTIVVPATEEAFNEYVKSL